MSKPEPVSMFISYAHEDEPLRSELQKHLSLLQRQGLISTWQDRQITAGTKWAQEIDEHLKSASIILLLVSADFVASDYCYGVEMQRALDRDKAGQARVIPIIVRPCDKKDAPFAHLQALPTDTRAITTWNNRDAAWTDVATDIRRVIEELPPRSMKTPSAAPPPPSASPIPLRSPRNISFLIIAIIFLLSTAGFFVYTSNRTSNTKHPSQVDHTAIFDFEQGTQGWAATSSGATISLTDTPVHSGHHALQVTTTLSATNAPRTDVTSNLSGNPGFLPPGPYNLSGKRASCQMFLPAGLAAKADPRAQVKLFVQSQQGGLNLGIATIINNDLVNRWITISLDVGASQKDTTHNFDATNIVLLGVRLETRAGSLVTYTGPFFIDDCMMT
jgi:TIR domain